MGTLTKEEQETMDMMPTWLALAPVTAFETAQAMFINEEMTSPADFNAVDMTARLQLAIEFREIWSQRVPHWTELIAANQAGKLQEEIDAINMAYTSGL
jgi:hypothetical protein